MDTNKGTGSRQQRFGTDFAKEKDSQFKLWRWPSRLFPPASSSLFDWMFVGGVIVAGILIAIGRSMLHHWHRRFNPQYTTYF
jgi:hypothetical protein